MLNSIKIIRNNANEVIDVIDRRPTRFVKGTQCWYSERMRKELKRESKHSFARHCRQKGDPRWDSGHHRNFYDFPPGKKSIPLFHHQ